MCHLQACSGQHHDRWFWEDIIIYHIACLSESGTSSSGCRLSLKDEIICRDNSTLGSLLEDILGIFMMNPALAFTHQW